MHPHVYLDRKLAQCAPAPTSQVHYSFTVKVVLELMLQSSSKFNTGIFTSVILKLCHLIVHLFVYCRHSSFSSSDSVFSPFLHPYCQSSTWWALRRRHLITGWMLSTVGSPEERRSSRNPSYRLPGSELQEVREKPWQDPDEEITLQAMCLGNNPV